MKFLAACLALIFLGWLAFCNAIAHPFVHDDVVFILKNPHINDLGHWYEAFASPSQTDGINTYYRPILEIIYRLEFRVFGPHPYGFHLFNIIVHILNGLLVFILLNKLNFKPHLSWAVALLFLVHPVQTEAVSCIAGISNLWMAFGVLSALNAYVNKWYAASLLFLIFAFLSKEQAILFLPLMIVIDCARGERKYAAWFMFFLASIGLMMLHGYAAHASLIKDIFKSPGELYLRVAAIPRDIFMYLRLIVFPYDLHYYRSTDILQSNTRAFVLAALSLVILLVVLRRWPRSRLTLGLGLGWFLAALLPVLNITPLINEYSLILTSEHFLYLPIIGILIILVTAGDALLPKIKTLIFGLTLTACFILTWHQNTYWSSEIRLFERMLNYERNFGRGQLLLAKAYYFNGQPQKADPHYNQALRIMNSYVARAQNATAKAFYLSFSKEILFDWAQNDAAMGRWPDALQKLKMEETLGPDAAMYNNMAFIYLHLGDKNQAAACLHQALALDPSFIQARENLQALGDPKSAI